VIEPFSSTIVVPSLNATDFRALRSGSGSCGRRVTSDHVKCGAVKFTSPAMIAVFVDISLDGMLLVSWYQEILQERVVLCR
jgi:hypothetical protein